MHTRGHVHERASTGVQHWLENIARFKPAEMAAGVNGIRDDMLRFYTIAFIFTTNSDAQKMCDDGGIAARRTEGGALALSVCLRPPATLGWQKNAGGRFRQNVAALMGMPASDVQAMVIMGIPARAIEEAGCIDDATFTIEERPEELKLLTPRGGSEALYSSAHIAKVYELEPGSIVAIRKELAELQSSANSRGAGEQAAQEQAARRRIQDLQDAEAAPAEELADVPASDGEVSQLSLEEALKLVAAAEARANRERARADREKARADKAETCAGEEKARAETAEARAQNSSRCIAQSHARYHAPQTGARARACACVQAGAVWQWCNRRHSAAVGGGDEEDWSPFNKSVGLALEMALQAP